MLGLNLCPKLARARGELALAGALHNPGVQPIHQLKPQQGAVEIGMHQRSFANIGPQHLQPGTVCHEIP
nr:hypothetical protein NCPCFENI_01193 [Cupriavidus sp.]